MDVLVNGLFVIFGVILGWLLQYLFPSRDARQLAEAQEGLAQSNKEIVRALRNVVVPENDAKSVKEGSFEISSSVITSYSGTITGELESFGVIIKPSVPFIVMCHFRKRNRWDTIWMGLRLNSTPVDGPDGRIISVRDTPHEGMVTWYVGAVDERQLRRIRMNWPTGFTVTDFGDERKPAETIGEIAIHGKSSAGYMEILQFLACSWPS